MFVPALRLSKAIREPSYTLGTFSCRSHFLVRAVWEAVAAYEQTLYQKHGRNQAAGRARQKTNRKGVYQALVEWGKLHGNRPGFKSLIEAGLPEFTFEAVIVRFSERFPADVVEACRHTLAKVGAKI